MNPGVVIRAVFPGDAEGRVFDRMQSLWGQRYNIWRGLPLSLALNTSSSLPPGLKGQTVDFTVCNKEDTPLMCVGVETPGRAGTDLSDVQALAAGAGIPVHLVSVSEATLSDEYAMKMVDTIISNTIGQRDVEEEHQEYELLQQPFLHHVASEMPGEGSSPMILDWYGGDEVDAATKYDPLAHELEILRSEFIDSDRGICPWGAGRLSCSMKASLTAISTGVQGHMRSYTLDISTHAGAATSGTVSVSDFNRAEELAQKLAGVLALSQALKLVRPNPPKL